MAVVFPFSGATFYIGGSIAAKQTDFVASDFSGVTWVAIGGITEMGEFGDQASFSSVTTLGQRREIPYLTGFGGGNQTLTLAMDELDTGQAALNTAGQPANVSTYYAFKLQPDNAEGGTAGQVLYIARVSPPRFSGGNNTSATLWSYTLSIGSNSVLVPRVPA